MNASVTYARAWAVAALTAVTVAACSPGGDAQSTARRFLDAHYVRIDLDAARELCTGLARAKVDHELELTSEVSIEADTLQPRVTYRLETARERGDVAQLAYVLTIRPPGLEPFDRLVTLTVRNIDGAWSVTNYADSDRATGP